MVFVVAGMRRALLATVVALLCVVAGCGGGGAPATDEPDTTATPTPTGTTTDAPNDTTTTTTTDSDDAGIDAIPGVEDGAVSDIDALFEANAETLADRDFVRTRTFELDYLAGADRPNWTRQEVERYEAGTARIVRERIANDSGPNPFIGQSTLYVDEAGAIFRDRYDDDPAGEFDYRGLSDAMAPLTPRDTVDAFRLQRFFETANYTLSGTRTVDGETLYVFRASENAAYDIPNGSFRSRMVVDDRGQIRSATTVAVLRNASSGEAFRWRYQYELVRVGNVTVETPEWVERRRDGD